MFVVVSVVVRNTKPSGVCFKMQELSWLAGNELGSEATTTDAIAN